MSKLELYLDKFDNKQLYNSIYDRYKDFGYDSEELYKLHLNFMLKHCYDITIIENKKVRLGQHDFGQALLNKFNGKCVIT